MAENKIHLSFLPQYKNHAAELLKDNTLKKELLCEDGIMELVIDVDVKDTLHVEQVCKEITGLIINIMKNKLLKEYISQNNSDTYEWDKDDIYMCSLDLFEKKEPFIRYTVQNKVYDYILNNDYLNIDGFVTFRMKEFMKYISAIGDIALEEYLIKKDQDEFISVLKYFINIQEEKIDLLRVHIMNDSSFILYDKYGNKIQNIEDEEILNMVIRENLNYEDFLISTLLSLCPKKIEILDSLKNNSSSEIVDTIKSIFGDRVSIILQN